MNKTDHIWSMISGALLVYIGPEIVRTGIFTYGIAGDHFEIHPWVGWFLTLVGLFWLAEGLYFFLGGKHGKKDSGNANGTSDQDDDAPRDPGGGHDQAGGNDKDDTDGPENS